MDSVMEQLSHMLIVTDRAQRTRDADCVQAQSAISTGRKKIALTLFSYKWLVTNNGRASNDFWVNFSGPLMQYQVLRRKWGMLRKDF